MHSLVRPFLRPVGRYLTVVALGNLVWEVAQLPFYTLWVEGTRAQIGFALIHCTLGDVLIGVTSLFAALFLMCALFWPTEGFRRVACATVILALGYTIFSEWLNVHVRHTWAYRDIMPTLPWIGTGLSPLLQWLVVPLVALWYVSKLQR